MVWAGSCGVEEVRATSAIAGMTKWASLTGEVKSWQHLKLDKGYAMVLAPRWIEAWDWEK